MRTSVFISLCLAATAWGQPGGVNGPTSGYVFDSESRTLRPIRGVAGIAHLGAALVADADAASVSNDGALAVTSRLGSIEIIRGFDSAAPLRVVLAQEPGSVLFAWSGHDLAAVLTAARKVLIWRDGPTHAPASFSISGIDGDIRRALLDGEKLVIAAKGGLYLVKNGETTRLATLEEPSAMILSGGDLFAADFATGQVLRIRDYAGSAAIETFATVGQPVGLQIVRRNLLVASAKTRSVDVFDVATKVQIGSVELDFLPTRMESVGTRPLALLNEGSPGEPLYVLDSKDSPQVYFVPAGREQ